MTFCALRTIEGPVTRRGPRAILGVMRIPIWLVPVALGGWLYASGEDPGMGLPFVVGPAAVAWLEGWWSHRAARVEAGASILVARIEADTKIALADRIRATLDGDDPEGEDE